MNTATILAPVPAVEFVRLSVHKGGVAGLAVSDAIKAGPASAIPIRVDSRDELRRMQHNAHIYAVRKGYRIQTKSDPESLIVYIRVVKRIYCLLPEAGRPRLNRMMRDKRSKNV